MPQKTHQTLALPVPATTKASRAEAYWLDAFGELVQGLSCRPEPRYLFDEVLSRGRSYWRQLVNAHTAVINAGQDLTHALAFVRALEGFVRVRVAERDGQVRSAVRSAIRDMAYIDAHGDCARVEAVTEPSPQSYRLLLGSIDREIAALEQLKRHVQQELALQVVA